MASFNNVSVTKHKQSNVYSFDTLLMTSSKHIIHLYNFHKKHNSHYLLIIVVYATTLKRILFIIQNARVSYYKNY